jgi:hypothetical protein
MDWIKTGWGSEYSPKFHPLKNYYMDYSGILPTNKPLLEVSTRVINDITKSYPAPYNLMVSGGVDSQTMLWCWLNSGVEFQVYSFRLVNSCGKIYNEHDYKNLQLFAENHSIRIKFVDFNIFDFLHNRLDVYAAKYTCTSPQITAHMAMSELISKGTKLLSGNFIPGGLYTYTILGLERYAKQSGFSVIPFFLMHDPELAGNLIQYDTSKRFKEPMPYSRKVKLLEAAGVPIIPQEDKFTGFEKIKDYYDKATTLSYQDKIKYHAYPSKRNFDVLFRYRLTDNIKYVDNVKFAFPSS